MKPISRCVFLSRSNARIASQRVFLKPCFQVSIVLPSADEGGICRVRGCVVGVRSLCLVGYEVSGSSPIVVYLVVRPRALVSHSGRLVTRVKRTTARTASMSGVQWSLSVLVFPQVGTTGPPRLLIRPRSLGARST